MQTSFSDGKSIPSKLYLFIKGLMFVILCRSFMISSWFNVTITAYWKHLLPILLIGLIVAFLFLFNQENLYVIHHDSDLSYDIYNTITEDNQRQTHYCDVNFLWIKNFFYNFICFIINCDFYVIYFWIYYTFFIIIYRRNKVICYC